MVTGKDGKARVTFKAPSALSEYRIMARGVTGSDTLVGQTTSSLTVRKNFFVDLKIPSSLTQGDKPRFIAQVHHLGAQGTVSLKLAVYAGGRDEVYPRTVEIKGDGVEEVMFEPFEVPDAESVRLTLTGTVGELTDELTTEIPVRPWGVQAYASASGTSSDGTAVFVGLPKGRTYESPEMMIVISPTLERMIVELALGRDFSILSSTANCRIMPPPAGTTADRAADLLAATSALSYLRTTRSSGTPDAQRVSDRIQGLVAELIAAQNEDGGWPWVSSGLKSTGNPNQPAALASDRLTSASVLWALALAEQAGLLPDPKVLDKAVAWLTQSMASGTNSRDLDARAALLHALSTRRAATFEMANSLNRERQSLSNTALAYLALTFANLNRPELAGEILGILTPRAKAEPVAPGRPARLYWEGSNQSAGARGTVETTALVSLAFARVRPQAAELDRAIDWLHAHRFGHGWNPHRAKGPALAALALYHGRAKGAEDRYRLTVTVNDTKVAELAVQGSSESRAIAVPVKALKAGDANRVGLAMEGRGTFSYAVTMTGFTRDFGPDQDRANRPAWVDRRVYWPAPAELDGKVLPTGFGVAVNPSTFENVATQVALGGKARVGLTVWRNIPVTTPEWERDFLVVEEHLPAGTTLIEGSVQTSASSYTLADGVLTFYFAPGPEPRRHPVRRLRLPSRPVPDAAGLGQERLRAGAVPPGPARRVQGSGPGRKEHRSVSPVARRAVCSRQGAFRRRPLRRGGRGARAAVRRLHAARRRGQGRRADAAADQHQGLRAPQGRPVLRGGQGKGPRADPQLRPVAGHRPGLSRHQRIRAGDHRLARADRGQLPRGRPGRRAASPARQDARGDDLPDRPLADLPQHALDRERLLRPLPGSGTGGVQGLHRPQPPP